MPQQYPSRSSVHRPTPLPAPASPRTASQDEVPVGSRTTRRQAERTAERHRRALRRRRAQTGSLAAVASAALLVTVAVARDGGTAETPPGVQDSGDATALLRPRDPAASRTGDRSPVPVAPAPLTADAIATPADDARTLADDTLTRAAQLVATEVRTTPEVRAEVKAASTVVMELLRRADATEGQDVDLTDDTDLAAAVDDMIEHAATELGVDGEQVETEPAVVAHALARTAADLDAILTTAAPAPALVTPAPLSPAQVLDQQVAEGHADAERLAPLARVTDGHANGRLPAGALTNLTWAPDHRLRPDAAAQLERLNTAFHAEFGHDLHITSSFRSFEGQVRVRRTHGHLAATPGTSNHGWGVAVDLGAGIQRFGTATHRWMRTHAPRFGWELPAWAQENGAKPEPWHWEFEGVPDAP